MHAYMYDVNEVFYLNVKFKAPDLQITALRWEHIMKMYLILENYLYFYGWNIKKNECTFKMPMKPFIQIEKLMTSGSGVNALG